MDGLQRYIRIVEDALADDGDPWEVFATFMRRAVDADTDSLTLHLAGTFTPTEEMLREGNRAALPGPGPPWEEILARYEGA